MQIYKCYTACAVPAVTNLCLGFLVGIHEENCIGRVQIVKKKNTLKKPYSDSSIWKRKNIVRLFLANKFLE